MANSPTAAKPGGLSRGKAALIAVLGVVLVGVLYIQFGGGGGAGSSGEPKGYIPRRTPAVHVTETSAEANKNTITNVQNSSAPAVASAVDAARWKSPDLTNVVDYDPFALPGAFPKPKAIDPLGSNAENLVTAAEANDEQKLAEARAQLESELQALKESGVQVIVRVGDQYVAMIGDKTYEVGQAIGGFIVTEIDPSGVVIEKKASQ